MTVADYIHCVALVVYGYEQAISVYISSRTHAGLKSEHQHRFIFTIEEDVAQNVGLCSGEVNCLYVSSLSNA